MRLLIRLGRFAEALTVPPTLSLTEIRDPNARQTAASALLVCATALIALGNRVEAQEHISQVQQASRRNGWYVLAAEANNLATSF